MKTLTLFAVTLVLTIALGAQDKPTSKSPVVVELFTAEGCSSCPPADELLSRLVEVGGGKNPDVIALGEHVDYWNEGWVDRFSSPSFTSRQKEYASKFKLDSTYTPQMVIDGSAQTSGNNQVEVVKDIQAAIAQEKPAKVELQWQSAGQLHITVQSKDPAPAEVLLAITEDGLTTAVGKGENKGRTLQHVGVVRQLKVLGSVSKSEYSSTVDVHFDSKWNRDKVKVAVLVQKKKQGAIIGAATTRYPAASAGAAK